MPTAKTLSRVSLILATLSSIGGALTLNEALRHLRRTTTRTTIFSIKAALAALSLAFSLGFIILAARYLRDASTHAHLRIAAFIGIGVELIYQGFEIYFYATPPALGMPHAPKALLMASIIQAAIFGAWMIAKIILYVTLASALTKEQK